MGPGLDSTGWIVVLCGLAVCAVGYPASMALIDWWFIGRHKEDR